MVLASQSTFSQNLYDAVAEEEGNRLRRFQRAWRSYHGDPPKPLRFRPGTPDDNVLINLSKVIVDKGVASLMSHEPLWTMAGAVEGTPELDYLTKVWRSNKKSILLHDLALNGGVTGHVFARLRLPDPDRGQLYTRITALDPSTVFPVWDPHDITHVEYYRIQYNFLDPVTSKMLVFRQFIERAGPAAWHLTDQVSDPDAKTWTTIQEEEWPHPYAPLVEAKNLPAPNEYWGLSDIEADTLHITNTINRLVSNLNKIVRIHGHPKVWFKGVGDFAAAGWDISIDRAIELPTVDSAVGVLQVLENFSGPLALLAQLKDALYEVARTPAVSLGKLDNVGPISGAALNILYGPLIEKTQSKQLTYGDMFDDLNRRLLDLAGLAAYEDIDIDTHWGSVLPSDPMAAAQTAVMQQQVGVSKRTLVSEMGYDPDIEETNNQAAAQVALEQATAQAQAQALANPPATTPASNQE